MSIAAALAQAATLEIEAGGIHWRVRAITSADLVEAGGGFLLSARKAVAEDVAPDADPVDIAVAATKALARDPAAAVKGQRFFEAVVVAGLRAASMDGESWEDLRATLDPRGENQAQKVLHVSSLPPGAVIALGRAILTLSTDGGAAGERLRSFLGGGAPRAPRGRE